MVALAWACAGGAEPRRSAKLALARIRRASNGIGVRVEHAAGILVVEALAIDEEQRAPLLRRQVPEKIRGERVEIGFLVLRKEPLEILFTRLRLTQRIGVMREARSARAGKSRRRPSDRAESRADSGADLLSMRRRARRSRALPSFFSPTSTSAKRLSLGSMAMSVMPHELVIDVCLHALIPRRLGECWRFSRGGASPHANQ